MSARGQRRVTEGSLSAEETSLGDELYFDTRILYALVNESTGMQTRTHNNRKNTHSQSHTHTIKDTHANTHDHTCIPMHVYLYSFTSKYVIHKCYYIHFRKNISLINFSLSFYTFHKATHKEYMEKTATTKHYNEPANKKASQESQSKSREPKSARRESQSVRGHCKRC